MIGSKRKVPALSRAGKRGSPEKETLDRVCSIGVEWEIGSQTVPEIAGASWDELIAGRNLGPSK